jgi:hypothetical protein
MNAKKILLFALLFTFLNSSILSADDTYPCIDNVTIATATGETSLLTCQGDDVDGIVKFKTSTSAFPFAYVVVDEAGTIFWIGLTNNIDLSPFQDGEYRIYAFSFLGSLIAEVGGNIFTDELASYCYELTINYVSLNSGAPDAGNISTNDDILVCVGDGIADMVNFTNTNVGDEYVYFAADHNNLILEISFDGSFDFDGYAEGGYFVWGYAYFGNLLAAVGMDITVNDLSDGCGDLTETFIAISASSPDGGIVSLEDFSVFYDVCNGLNTDVLSFISTTTSQASYVYVLANDNNIITEVLGGNSIGVATLLPGNNYIWGISYTGVSNILPGTSLTGNLSDDCYEISENSINLFKENYQAGSISLEGGETEITLCVADGIPDVLNFVSTGVSGGEFFTFIITDEQNNILDFSTNGSLDFDTAPSGTCLIWGLTYDGNLSVNIGDDLTGTDLSDACYDLSDNFITVNREAVAGGVITFTLNGDDYFEYCSNKEPIELGFESAGSIGDHFRYITTDDMGNITGIHPASTTINPIAIFSYTRYIYWISFTGDDFTGDEIAELSGQNIDNAVLRDGCYQLSSNRAELRVSFVDGGTVQLDNESTSTIVCATDDVDDLLTFENINSSTENQAYLLTDGNNVITTFLTGPTVDMTVAANGDYRIWSVSYTGELIAEINDIADEVALSDGCYDLSENFIEIFKTDVEGGTVSTLNGDTFLMICPDGNAPVTMNFSNDGAIGNGYAYVLTDEDGVIVSTLDGNVLNFLSLPIAGILKIWGIAYTGIFDAPFGENIESAILSNECYDLSENFVEIIYENAQAGTITANGGLTELEICIGDGFPDVITFEVTDATHLNYAYILTTEEGFITGVLEEDSFDFDNTIEGGNCRIYGLSYSGFLTLLPGDNILDITPSSDCWDLTDEYFTLIKNQVDGGLIFSDIPGEIIYVCAEDGEADLVNFTNSTIAAEANYQYILTTDSGVILSFVDGDQQDFEGTGFTTLQVWGLSYTGTLNMAFGLSINEAVLSDECYTLSDNYLTVIRDLPEGGDLVTVDGETNTVVCIGAGSGIVELATSSASASGYVYLLLDSTGVILEVSQEGIFDFNAYDPGLYRVWGLSYTGPLYAQPGLLASAVVLAGSCYEFSNNLVEIVRSEPVDGGMVSINGSDETVFYTCPGDDITDLIILETTSLDPDYSYIITDTTDIVTIPQIIGPVIDFNAAAPGEYRIYGISYNGNSIVGYGINILEDPLSDNCYTHSENYITIIIGDPEGGTVTSDQGDNVTFIVGDGEADVLTFSADNTSEGSYVYVITNESNEILGFVDGDTQDFDGAAPGVCHVWGVAYTGTLSDVIGETITDVALSDDCYSLSENYVTLNRTDEPFAGETSFLSLKTFPNPAAEHFTTSFVMKEQTSYEAEIVIFNTTGQIVKTMIVETVEGDNAFEIAISQLLPGLYFLQIRNEHEKKSTRFLKQ